MAVPGVIVLAGPNGAGKTTAAPHILRDVAQVTEFVNADTIAQGLAGFDVESAALAAGRVMLTRLQELASERRDFAFETTLASRSFAPWLRELGCETSSAYTSPSPQRGECTIILRSRGWLSWRKGEESEPFKLRLLKNGRLSLTPMNHDRQEPA